MESRGYLAAQLQMMNYYIYPQKPYSHAILREMYAFLKPAIRNFIVAAHVKA